MEYTGVSMATTKGDVFLFALSMSALSCLCVCYVAVPVGCTLGLLSSSSPGTAVGGVCTGVAASGVSK